MNKKLSLKELVHYVTADELKHWKKLARDYMNYNFMYVRKIHFNEPKEYSLADIKDRRTTAETMVIVFQDSMLEKYPLKPMVSEPPPILKSSSNDPYIPFWHDSFTPVPVRPKRKLTWYQKWIFGWKE